MSPPDPAPLATGSWSRWWNLLGAAADGLAASPARFVVGSGSVAFAVFWIVSGLAIAEGLRQQGQEALAGSADLFVAGDAFGTDVPLAASVAEPLRQLPGVEAVVPRIVGRARVADEWVVVVGVDRSAWQNVPADQRVPLPAPGGVWLGADLAGRTGWQTGKKLVLEAQQAVVLQVEGVFASGAGIGSARAIVLDREDAATLFDQRRDVSDLLVYCRPGYADKLARAIARDGSLRVQTRDLVARYLDQAYTVRSGAMMLIFALALVVAVLLFLLLADLGAASRHRDLAILKMSGWATRDVLGLCLMENLLVAVAGSSLGILLSFVWVRLLNAPLLRAYFLPGADATGGDLALPSRFGALPLTASLVLSLALTFTAGILATWRSTVVPPSTALRM